MVGTKGGAEEDAAELSKMAAKMGVLVKSPERIRTLVKDIVEHYQTKGRTTRCCRPSAGRTDRSLARATG